LATAAETQVETSVDYTHLRGRTYEVTCAKGYRPVQLPRQSVVVLYAGEITMENAPKHNVMFVRDDLAVRLEALYAQGNPDGSDLTFNEALDRLLTYAEMLDAVGPDPDPGAWRQPVKVQRDEHAYNTTA
jgi:hypothetical protein